ncbi:hypothetical protein [Phosphitispora fastidiosa]|uniref:hypothetical protein n=1 Tax=Phosphitispora fastidiosa TaxID=2837202 RepID=UPI001E3FABFF|nr:hypothetical protein [Phosphitispora fastidiosa]MBU7008859.1 hypothetical protein [Phosphitispora fastidiosa]
MVRCKSGLERAMESFGKQQRLPVDLRGLNVVRCKSALERAVERRINKVNNRSRNYQLT